MTTEIIIFIILIIGTLKSPHSNILGCGLIGFVPNEKGRANVLYMKLIASYNAVRGTDSCGFYINNKVHKSLLDIRQYLANNKLEQFPNTKNKIIIGHTRKGTFGKISLETAHPFEVYNDTKTSKLILVHNGTLTNTYNLSKQYDIPFAHGDVDSCFLAQVLQKTKSFDILKYYEGAAALMFAYEEEPNVLYLFKGASKNKWTDEKMSEERPLYFIRLPEGIYISSLREPLDAIANGDKKIVVMTIPINEVVKVKDNKTISVEKIDRSKINEYVAPAYTPYQKHLPIVSSSTTKDKTKIQNTVLFQSNFEIFKELTTNFCLDHVMPYTPYFIGGRYCDFTTLPDDRCKVRICSEISEKIENFYMDGEYEIMETDGLNSKIITEEDKKRFKPERIKKYFFCEGVLISTDRVKDWENKKLSEKIGKLPNQFEKVKQLSAFCDYPICLPYDIAIHFGNSDINFYFKGNVYKKHGKFHPLFSYRSYQYSFGDLLQIDTTATHDVILKGNPIKTESKEEEIKKDFNSLLTPTNDLLPIVIILNSGWDGNDIELYREELTPQMETITVAREAIHGFDPLEIYTLTLSNDTSLYIKGGELNEAFVKYLIETNQYDLYELEDVTKFNRIVYDASKASSIKDYFLKLLNIDINDYREQFVMMYYWDVVMKNMEEKSILEKEQIGEQEEELLEIGNEGFGNNKKEDKPKSFLQRMLYI